MTNGEMYKKEYFKELLIVALLLMAYAINIPFLILTSFALACFLVVFSKDQKSVYYLAFFTSFAGVFVYQGRHMFFVMVALFILKTLVKNRINRETVAFYFVILTYSILFSDVRSGFSFAKMIGLILLFAIPSIAELADKFDCRIFLQNYIFGFLVATVIGFFVKSFPSMYRLFEVDLIWTEKFQEVTRFFGLAYDSNFYALSNYLIIAYLLFAFKKITPFRGFLILFLLISGLMTISKSYFLITGFLFILYLVNNISKMKRMMAFILAAVIGVWAFSIVSSILGYNVIELIQSRFIPDGSFADNTTGRTDIWKEYMNLFQTSGAKEFLFGFGFNAKVLHAAHNTLIEFIYHYGIAGLILWGAYFRHCFKLFQKNTVGFVNKSPVVCFCLVIGIFFLSAYTYEAFWIGVVISLMTLGKQSKGEEVSHVQYNSANLQG